jgi:flagellar protein FlaG
MIQDANTVRTMYPDPARSVQLDSKSAAGVQTLLVKHGYTDQRPRSESIDLHSLIRADGNKQTIAQEQRMKMIEQAIKSVQGPTTRLDFSIHDKTNDVIIRVVDKETGEVIREIPPEKTLDILSKLMEIAGLLVDERV